MFRDDSLDVDSPEQVERVLRAASQSYLDSAGELCAAWQDPTAGQIWADFARILDRAADQCEKARAKRGV